LGKVKVRFFGGLIEATGGKKELEASASDIYELLDEFVRSFGESFKERVLNNNSELRPFVNVYVNNKDIRFLDSLKTQLKEGDSIIIMPAVGGG